MLVCRALIAFLSSGDVLLEVCVKFVKVDYIVVCSKQGKIVFRVNVEVQVVTLFVYNGKTPVVLLGALL